MRNSWPVRVASFFVAVLLLGGLTYLQTLAAERDLLFSFTAYAVIAVAALLAAATVRLSRDLHLACLVGTLAFVGYVIVRALTSPVVYAARTDLYLCLAALVVYGVVCAAFPNPKVRIGLVVALLAFAVGHVLVSVVQAGMAHNYSMLFAALEDVDASDRATGLYVNPDHLAGLLEVLGIFGLSITCWSRWPQWAKVCVGYLTAVAYFGLALTGSRGGYLSAAASLIAFALLSLLVLQSAGTRDLLRRGGIGLILIGLAVYAAWTFIQQTPVLSNRAAQVFTADKGRLDLWQAAIEQWKLRPVVGTGSGTYLFYGREFRAETFQQDPVDVHNDYLHLLCEYGVLGAAAFLLFFGSHVWLGWRSFVSLGPKRVAAGSFLVSDRLALTIGALCAMAAYLVHSAVDFNLHIPANALVFAIVFALLATPGTQDAVEVQRPVRTLPLRLALGAAGLVLLVQSVRLLPGEHHGELARVALRDEDPASAIAHANKAIEHDAQNPYNFFRLGRALLALGNTKDHEAERPQLYQRALDAFDAARKLAPLDGSYPVEMAYVYNQLGRFDEAEAMLNFARTRDPRSKQIAQLFRAHQELRESAKQQPPPENTTPPN